MFSRRHYIAIAQVLAATRTDHDFVTGDGPTVYVQKREIIARFVSLFRGDNLRFQERAFRDACESDPILDLRLGNPFAGKSIAEHRADRARDASGPLTREAYRVLSDREPESHGSLCASRASGECTCGEFDRQQET